MASPSLFDMIYERVGCPCLSDLRLVRWRAALLDAVRFAKAEEYSAREWRELIEYLTANDPPEGDAGSLREYLLQKLDI